MNDETGFIALLDQMDATARHLTLVLEADQRCDLLAQEFIDTATNPFRVRRHLRARDLYRKAHALFMQRRYQEVLDL